MAEKIRFWNCPFCKAQGIPQEHARCIHCGAERPKRVKLYTPQQVWALGNVQAEPKPDWRCEYCGAGNVIEEVRCASCGAARRRAPVYRIDGKREFMYDQEPEAQMSAVDYYYKVVKPQKKGTGKQRPLPGRGRGGKEAQRSKGRSGLVWAAGCVAALTAAGLIILASYLIFR